MHLMEEELKRHNIPVVFKRLLAEAMFATNAFTFYNGASPYNALTGANLSVFLISRLLISRRVQRCQVTNANSESGRSALRR